MKGFTLMIVVFTIVGGVSSAHTAIPQNVTVKTAEIDSKGVLSPKGMFTVYVKTGQEWANAGTVRFDEFIRTQTIDLSKYVTSGSDAVIRFEKSGGGLSHIDSVKLGGKSPIFADPFKAAKLGYVDNDLLDLRDADTMAFLTVGGGVLEISARIEPETVGGYPFMYPSDNQFELIGEDSEFYTYAVGSGDPSKPFFTYMSHPSTGHPAGTTYGYVWNDGKNLYAKIDFTSDNTYDGEKDYAAVYIRTASGVNEYKSSMADTKWGMPQFDYTPNAGYQHKVYQFNIPLSEAGEGGTIDLAFSAYGTSAVNIETAPAVIYNPYDNQYLTVFFYNTGVSKELRFRLFSAAGVQLSNGILLSTNSGFSFSSISGIFVPDTLRYVLSFGYYDGGSSPRALALILRNDLSPITPVIGISPGTMEGSDPAVAYDSDTKRLLFVFTATVTVGENIYGQFMDMDGNLTGAVFSLISNTNNQRQPDLIYNPVSKKYFMTYGDDKVAGNARTTGAFFDKDGIMAGLPFAIGETTNVSHQRFSAVFDSVSGKCLVVWDENVSDWEINARFVTTAGLTNGPVKTPCSSPDSEYNANAYFNPLENNYLLVWLNGESNIIYGQYLDLQFDPQGSAFVIATNLYANFSPSYLTYNSQNRQYVVAYTDNADSVAKLALIGTNYAAGNQPPSAPALVSPADNASAGTSVTLDWNASTDPDGDAVYYQVLIGTNSNFTDPSSYLLAKADKAADSGFVAINFAGLAFIGFAGMLLMGKRTRKLFILPLMAGGMLLSCTTNEPSPTQPPVDATKYTVSGLTAGKTYYWKVIAHDTKDGAASSDVWSFNVN